MAKKPDPNKQTFTVPEGAKELILALAREDRYKHFSAEIVATTSDDDGSIYDVRVEADSPVWLDWVSHELKRHVELTHFGKASLLNVPVVQ